MDNKLNVIVDPITNGYRLTINAVMIDVTGARRAAFPSPERLAICILQNTVADLERQMDENTESIVSEMMGLPNVRPEELAADLYAALGGNPGIVRVIHDVEKEGPLTPDLAAVYDKVWDLLQRHPELGAALPLITEAVNKRRLRRGVGS